MLKTQKVLRWLPIFVGVFFIVITLLLWKALEQRDQRYISRSIELRAKSVKNKTEKILQSHILSLKRMAHRWESSGGTPKEEWESDAVNYVNQLPVYQAIEWVDSSFRVRWIVPLKGNEEAQDLNLGFEGRRQIALEQARDLRKVTATRTIELVQGGKGFLVYIPLYLKEEFNGFILGVFSIQDLFDFVLSDTDLPGYSFAIFDGEDEVYSNNDQDRTHMIEWGFTTEIKSFYMTFRLLTWPMQELFAKDQSILPQASLGIGLLVSFLFSLTVYFAQKSSEQTKQVKLTNQEMQKEIIARKQIGEELKELNESKKQIQLLLDSTGEAIYGLDNDGNCNFTNAACLRILRYKEASQLIGENMHNLIHHTKQDGTPYLLKECRIYQAFREGKGTHIDDEVLWRANGSCFPAEYMSYPVLKENKIIGAVVTFFDITERKKIESELRESEERYRILVKSVKDYAIFMTTPDGIISSWNEGVKKIKGYSADEIIGKHISIFYEEEDIKRGKIEYELQKAREDGQYEDEGWRVRKDGSRFWANVIITALYDDSRTLKGYTEVTRDFTERKKAEEQLVEKSKKIESINKELRDFVFIISHDLKEPLFAIEGFTSQLTKAYENIYDEKAKHYVNRIMANIKVMSERIRDLLDVIKVGTVEYTFTDNNSGDIVNDVVNEMESKLENNKIKVTIQDNLPRVVCDRKRLTDVFSNLISNAIKFIIDNNQRQIQIGCDREGEYYKFFVEDTGIGIQKEHQKLIFKIFTRLKSIETEGTGVGLAISKKIVELHKGKVWVESPVKDGRGTRFCFTIPISKKSSGQN